MKGCDVILDLLLARGIDTFFVITGGAIVPLIDAIGRKELQGSAKMVAFQHEQGAAFAAEGYWRETGRLPAVVVTSGPGIQNVLNGLCGCYYDSIPMLVISGQVNTAESLDAISSKPRQRGFQEMPVVDSFGHFCKYAKKLKYVHDLFGHEIFEVFSSAIKAATTPRFGPSLIDLPVNIQMCDVDPSFVLPPAERNMITGYAPVPSHVHDELLQMLEAASRPLIIFGAGFRASGSEHLGGALVQRLAVPFCLSWGAKDLFDEEHHLNCGSHGVYGSRSANLAVQNCDLLIVLGSRLDTRQTGGNLSLFAPTAKKVVVDCDSDEVGKLVEKGCTIQLPVIAELHEFVTGFVAKLAEKPQANGAHSEWVSKTREWKAKYSNADVDKAQKYDLDANVPGVMNVYSFLEKLDEKIPANSTVIPDQGGNLCWSMQTLKVKDNWRLYTNLGNSSMGFAFPCCIGSALGSENTVVCIDGDGGFQMNIQELKTAVDYNLPIKTFILNNSGYGIIKQFQDAYFDKRYIVTNFPPVDFVAIANGYGMRAVRITSESDIDKALEETFQHPGPVLVDVSIQQYQKIFPKLEFGNALEHMTPFIPAGELNHIMINDTAPRQEPKGWVQAK